ncbi:1-acyl-sn-glycerol-3-phosphate acyltransferase [Paucibacter sp. XJ19-41]|uniref:1-acyl-sn-glycerol-3-phosphate acyltransferase n=1 Tax=Paucibacter sp. XJ19-41 TaxID=2927824 RepID=UPI0023498064|nr:1-acyl-sn-glycerol-3-phosphate acyltransferase [Paucibacter sp. XJ19-41]MDC6168571.1 1-acyl-sn-glycerol-3-phosphate acyltransferase [Paucibacter sp. XJ19-41]
MSASFSAGPQAISGAMPVQPQGHALARSLLRLAGWRLLFGGLPGPQGVILVYPHTSNWDFVLGLMSKWALGLELRFWVKNSLFGLPLFGRWLRWLGGVAVERRSKQGLVGGTVAQLQAARAEGRSFWLAAAPEGTRSLSAGWRSGAYQVAVQAGVPVGLAYFDFASKTVGLIHFVQLSGNAEADFALMAQYLAGKRGKRPELASPVRLNP